jgi:thiol-disulfide isomerase/thioredoxin
MTTQTARSSSTARVAVWAIVVFVVLAGVAGWWWRSAHNPATDAARVAQQYTQLQDDNLFVIRDAAQAVDILKAGTGVVFFGFPECPWCQEMAPMIDDAAKAAGLDKVFYVNIKADRADNSPAYQQLVAMLGDQLEADNEGHPRIYVPDVAVVVKGQIIANETETATYSGDLTPAEYWTPQLRSALMDRFSSAFDQVVKAGGCQETCNA